jgi:hypothetical protein
MPMLRKTKFVFADAKYVQSRNIVGPFQKKLLPPPPPWTRSVKFEPPRKKDQSADAHPPSEIGKFLPFPPEKMLRSKDADGHNPPQNWLF